MMQGGREGSTFLCFPLPEGGFSGSAGLALPVPESLLQMEQNHLRILSEAKIFRMEAIPPHKRTATFVMTRILHL